MLPRGQGKSSLVAAWGLYELMLGGEGATVCVVAVDERQAGIVFGIARRMVELDDQLAARCQVFKERLVIRRGMRSFIACPPNRNGLKVWTTRWRSSTRLASPTVTATRC